MKRLWLLVSLIVFTGSFFMVGCCRETAECPAGSYCSKIKGDCNGSGIVTEMPGECPAEYDPVCGCDGETYRNACEAAKAGVNVVYDGECEKECRENEACDEGYYCWKSLGHCEREGICREKPESCPLVYDPVCGCDGITYENACGAESMGVSIAYKGVCRPDCTDDDGDDICDYRDNCPESNLDATISIDGCNSGVANILFEDGCTMNDLAERCAIGARNHGKFVSCIAHLTNDWKKDYYISGREKGSIQSCAAYADIP